VIVHKLTKENRPPPKVRVWLWRDDSKRWVTERFDRSIEQWLGHPDLAYTYWCELVEPPTPPYECEDCIGMKEHGCYCASVDAVAPGGPLRSIPCIT
jgi:hypothetical protein